MLDNNEKNLVTSIVWNIIEKFDHKCLIITRQSASLHEIEAKNIPVVFPVSIDGGRVGLSHLLIDSKFFSEFCDSLEFSNATGKGTVTRGTSPAPLV